MSSHGESDSGHEEKSTAEIAKDELEVFYLLKYSHLLTFIAIIVTLYAKEKQCYNFAQTVHCLIVVPLSMTCILLGVFFVKNNRKYWIGSDNATEVRVWIIIDVYYFFSWIVAGVIFVLMAYIFKFKSTMKDEDLLLQDNNPWNDKDTEDFLRHLKMEYLVFSYYFSAVIMNYVLGFYNGRDFETGAKDFYPSKVIMSLDMIQKFSNIIILTLIAANKIGDLAQKVSFVMVKLFNLVIGISIVTIFVLSNYMEGQNMFCRLWI